MPKTRVAMVACKSSYEGLWTRAKGNEIGIRIIHLVEGEHVRLDVMLSDTQYQLVFDQPGVFPLPWNGFSKYRVCKQVNPGVDPAPTTVEIELNGSAKVTSWNP